MDNKDGFLDEEKTYEPVKEKVGEDSALKAFLDDIAQLLESSQWDTARNTCDYAMRFYPQSEQLNCYKLMINFKVKKRESLRNLSAPFDMTAEFTAVMNGNDEELKRELLGYIDYINKRNENDRYEAIYRLAVREMNDANTPEQYDKASKMFLSVINYNNSAVLAENCKNEAEKLNKNRVYAEAKKKMNSDNLVADAYIEELHKARNLFLSIPGWMDSDSNAEFCLEIIERTKNKQEYEQAERKKKRKRLARRIRKLVCFIVPLAAIVTVAILCWKPYIEPGVKYLQAERLMKENKYMAAAKLYDELDGFADSTQKIAAAFKGELALYVAENDVDGAYALISTSEKYKVSKRNRDEMYKNYWNVYFASIEVGDEIYYGELEQTETYKGAEDIKWIVLDKTGENELLLISAYILDDISYTYFDEEKVDWYDSSLYDRFYYRCFSDYEKLVIDRSFLDDNYYSYVYALSKEEAQKYSHILQAKVTEYAYSEGAYVDSSGYGEWWLRNPEESEYSYYVNSEGEILKGDIHDYYGWRPVIKIAY